MTKSSTIVIWHLARKLRGAPAPTRAVLLAAARWYVHQGTPTPRQTAYERELGLAVAAWLAAVERGAPPVSRRGSVVRSSKASDTA